MMSNYLQYFIALMLCLLCWHLHSTANSLQNDLNRLKRHYATTCADHDGYAEEQWWDYE